MPLCDGRPHPPYNHKHARHAQIPPKDIPWYIFLYMAGRGAGKTRSAAEYCKTKALATPNSRIALIAPDFSSARDVMIEGQSGLRGLSQDEGVIPWKYIRNYNRSLGELYLTNGTQFKIFGTDSRKDAESIRGWMCSWAWLDEIGIQPFGDVAFAMLEFALRLGTDPRIIMTTTPRPTALIKRLVKDPDVYLVNESTYANKDNLPPKQLERIIRRYEGTTLGQQELLGLLLSEAQGALWTNDMIKRAECPETLARVVVAVDPAGTHRPDSDETGIIVVGMSEDRKCYVMADKSGRYSPDQWAAIAGDLFNEYTADAVIAESNYGGEMVKANLYNRDDRLPVKLVHSSRGKALRAHPCVSLYERGLVFHTATFSDLETQMTTHIFPGSFDADGEPIEATKQSPDRVDALCFGLTELALKPLATRGGARFVD